MRSNVRHWSLSIPKNDFLSPDGVIWGVVGENVTESNTVDNIETLFRTAKEIGLPVFIPPHYCYPADHGWKFEGTLEALMHNIGMFDRQGPLNLDGFEGSRADWLERYRPFIQRWRHCGREPAQDIRSRLILLPFQAQYHRVCV